VETALDPTITSQITTTHNELERGVRRFNSLAKSQRMNNKKL
jgi:hypothetical protein